MSGFSIPRVAVPASLLLTEGDRRLDEVHFVNRAHVPYARPED